MARARVNSEKATHSKENYVMGSYTAEGSLCGLMVQSTRENSEKMRSQARVDMIGLMAATSKEKSSTASVTVKASIQMQRKEWFTREIGRMDSDMATVFLNTETDRFMMVSGRQA